MSGKPLDCVETTSGVGKHDYVRIGTGEILHGPGDPLGASLRARSPDPIERYCTEKITELAMTQNEVTRLTRERDALDSMLMQLIAAKDEKDANGDSPRYRQMKVGLWERARETRAKLASGELRKP
jgi:hypothetical protein